MLYNVTAEAIDPLITHLSPPLVIRVKLKNF